ncbi:MAG: tandem-95 repeat protein [Candidatus Magnetomorum sp.]|nr:tandem-95 repeat protein [Candidatus Magnetomorum sp.]
MQTHARQAFQMLVFLISVIPVYAQAIDIGPVDQVYSVSHALDMPSSNPYIQMKWLPPISATANGYYVTFNQEMIHQFNEFNSADDSVIMLREIQITSQNFSGLDDVGYYFHIAAFAFDTNDHEFIGPTTTRGPFRIDTVAPLMPVVTTQKAVRERMITLLLGAYHASTMHISNSGYGENGLWEDFSAQRTWELRDIQGDQMIYVLFRDLAGNLSKASTAVRYDTLGPIGEISSLASLPARTTPIMLTITYNEPVAGLEASDILSENCQIQNFVSDPKQLSSQYVFECVPQVEGQVRVSIMENTVHDEAGNDNQTGSVFECVYDTSHPAIQSIPDQTIIENTSTDTLTFQLTNSHAYNGLLTLKAWADLPSLVHQQNIVFNNQSNPLNIQFTAAMTQSISLNITPQSNQSGSTMIHVMVSDATGITDHTAFQLDVWDKPDISQIPDLQMDEGTELSFSLVLTDVYKQNLTVMLTSSQPNLLGVNHTKLIGDTVLGATFPYNCQTSNQASISVALYMVPPPYQYGSVDLTLTATNAKDLSLTRAFTVVIQPVNDPPEIKLGTSANCFEDTTVQLSVSITDVDQNDLTVSAHATDTQLLPENRMQWIMNTNVYFNPTVVPLRNSKTQDLVLKLSPTANNSGQTTVTVRVDDGHLFMEKNVLFTVYPVNDPPVAPATLSFTINENISSGTVIGQIPANDVDNAILTFSIDSLWPQDHFQLGPSTGDIIAISTIDYETVPLYNLIAQITDGNLHISTSITLVVKNLNDNVPVFADNFAFTLEENTPIGTNPYTFIASDADNDTLSFGLNWHTVPTPFDISPSTGQLWIRKTVDYEAAHAYQATVTVFDGEHSVASPLTITVKNINEKPVISGSPGLTVAQGDYYEFQPLAIDPDEGDQLFFYTNNKPEWAGFDLQTGKLFGTPANQHVGIWKNINIAVRDKTNLYMSLPSFSITVINTNDPPIVQKPVADASVHKLSPLSLTIPQDTFIDVDPGDVLSYTASLSNGSPLPGWLRFDSVLLKFSGTPGILDGGVLSIQLTAVDLSLAATSDAFLLTIIDLNQIPQMTLPGAAIEFQENSPAVIIDAFARVTDDDSPNFDQGYLWVSFASGGSANDRLEIKDSGFGNTPIGLDKDQIYVGTTLIGSFSGGSWGIPLTIAFNHWANQAAVQSVLRNILFANDSENPSDAERRLEFKLSDGDGGTSLPVYKIIRLHAINDNPALFINNQAVDEPFELPGIQEDQSIVFNLDHGNRLHIEDKDADIGNLIGSIAAVKGIVTLNPLTIENLNSVSGDKTSNVSFSGTLSQINAVLDGLEYKSRTNEFGQETLTMRIKDNGYSGDGGGEFIYWTILFNISGENDPPVFSVIPHQLIDEDSTAQIVFSLTETDQENVYFQMISLQPDLISQNAMTLTGPSVNTAIGGKYLIEMSQWDQVTLTLTVMPNANKTGNASIQIMAYDSAYTSTALIELTITSVNDPPIVQNQSYVTAEDIPLSKTLSVFDADSDNVQIYLITLPQKGTVILNSDTMTFVYTPEHNIFGQDFFTYQAKDAFSTSTIGRIDISISPVNDPPVIEQISDQTMIINQTKTLTFSVTDIDSTFQVSALSDNTQLFPSYLTLVQNDSQYSLRLDPARGQSGLAHITIKAQETDGTFTQYSFDVRVNSSDNQGPVITLEDALIFQMDQYTTYTEPGYEAIDDIDGTVTASVATQSNLDTQTPGVYHITYRATDQAGNVSDPTERIIIVNKSQFSTVNISGNVVDDAGASLGWVDVKLEGQGKTYTAKTIYDGFFTITTPITFDGSVWRMSMSREDSYPRIIEFFEPTSFEYVMLLNKESDNAEVINGKCLAQQVDGSKINLSQATIYARSTITNKILSTAFSDTNGQFTLAVDVRNRPYRFEAVKYGYQTTPFNADTASWVVMVPITTIIIEKPEHMTDHTTARDMDKVTLSIRANPSFVGTTYELIVEPLTNSSMTPSKLSLSLDQYPIIYNAYEDFALSVRADTTENRDAQDAYFVEKHVYFKSLSPTAHIAVTKGSKIYQVDQPFFIMQTESSDRSFIRIDRSGLSGLNSPKELNYAIRDYTFPLEDGWYDHIVEFELSDEFGRQCADTSVTDPSCKNICLGIGFESPVTQSSIKDQTYEVVRAETVQDLLNGNYQSLSDVSDLNIYEKNITFCTSHLSAYGFRKKETGIDPSGGGDSGGGCFFMTVYKSFK